MEKESITELRVKLYRRALAHLNRDGDALPTGPAPESGFAQGKARDSSGKSTEED